MRGHLQRRGSDSWRLKVYVGRDANGTKRYVERTVNGTKTRGEPPQGRRGLRSRLPLRAEPPRFAKSS
jgi:hypothetical protein